MTETKTSLIKRKQHEPGKYSIVILCITWIKGDDWPVLTENWKWNDENTVENKLNWNDPRKNCIQAENKKKDYRYEY